MATLPRMTNATDLRGSGIDVALHIVLWLLVGIWLGGFSFFPVLADTAFRALPSADAGLVVGPMLKTLHLYGGAAGLVLAGLGRWMRRGAAVTLLPLCLGLLCLYSHFGVSVEIAEIRDQVFGPEGNTDAAARFNVLHQRSMNIFTGVTLAVALLSSLHARFDARRGTA